MIDTCTTASLISLPNDSECVIDIYMKNATFINDIDKCGITFKGKVRLINCVFNGDLSFNNCVFEQGLEICDCDIYGKFILHTCNISFFNTPVNDANYDYNDSNSLNLRGTHVNDPLNIINNVFHGNLMLNDMTCDSRVHITNNRSNGNININLSNLHARSIFYITDNIPIESNSYNNHNFSIESRGMTVANDYDCSRNNLSSILMNSCIFHGDISVTNNSSHVDNSQIIFDGAYCAGNVTFNALARTSSLIIKHSEFYKALTIRCLEQNNLSKVLIDRTTISGGVSVSNALIYDTTIRNSNFEDSLSFTGSNTKLDKLNLISNNIDGNIEIESIVSSNIFIHDNTIKGSLMTKHIQHNSHTSNCSIDSNNIDGKIDYCNNYIHHLSIINNKIDHDTVVLKSLSGKIIFPESITISANTISGEVELSKGYASTMANDNIECKLTIHNTNMGSLNFRNGFPAIIKMDNSNYKSITPRANPNPEDYINLISCTFPFHRSNYLLLEKFLRDQGSTIVADKVYREMIRRERRLQLGKFRVLIDIFIIWFSHRVLLSFISKRSRLITTNSFKAFSVWKKERVECVHADGEERSALIKQFDERSSWSTLGIKLTSFFAIAFSFINFLAEYDFQTKAIYSLIIAAIFTLLLSKGYIAWIASLLQDKIVGSGTQTFKALVIMSIIYIITYYIFTNTTSIKYKDVRTYGDQKLLEIGMNVNNDKSMIDKEYYPRNYGQDWNSVRSALFSLRFMFPMLKIDFESDWIPTSNRFTFLGINRCTMRYETYATIVSAINYLLVPLLVVSASGLLRRRGE